MERAVVVGFGGTTCGGKTTLSDILGLYFKERFKVKVIHQDDYYREPDDPHWNNDGLDNWDELEALHMDRMVTDVKAAIANHHLVIIEGILLYELQELSDLIDHRYYFTLPYDVMKSRRLLRSYIPIEPPGYFDRIVWPMYREQERVASADSTITKMDSLQTLAKLEETLKAYITRLLPASGRHTDFSN